MKKRLVAALMSGAMLLSVLGGCGQNDANTVDAQTEEKTELIFVNYRDIRDLNPHLYAGEMYAQSMLYDTLVSITDDGYEGCLAESWEISEDGKIVDVENEAGVGFINQPITGKLELTKTDVADGKPLPNAGFRIKDEDGNIVATGVTDENGIATFTLRYGKYTYQEYNAPEGYEIDESEYAFEIKEDGQIVKATMTNEKIPEELITTPKTGDDSRPGLWIGLSALSGAGVVAFGILTAVKMRKRKEEDKA